MRQMSDTKQLLERAWRLAPRPEDVMESLIRRRARQERNRRLAAAVLALGLALATFAGLIQVLRTSERPADQPAPSPSGEDIFADVHGWIVYGGRHGVWAVNPSRSGHPKGQIQLSERPGEPIAWSGDGSKLLIWRDWREGLDQRFQGLFVLRADGTETRLVANGQVQGIGQASFTPDGSQVVYLDSGMSVVDSNGGTPRILFQTGAVANPTFSPDGTQIAYFAGMGDSGNRLRVMNADGSGDRVLIDSPEFGHIDNLVWAPDGSRLAFAGRYGQGIWVVGADGSGLTRVAHGTNVHWSPDGSHIAYTNRGTLKIARWDGTHVKEFGYARSGPWNPCLPRCPVISSQTATLGSQTATPGLTRFVPFVYVIVTLGVAGMFVLVWRRRRKDRSDVGGR